jgi:hypothetical protein
MLVYKQNQISSDGLLQVSSHPDVSHIYSCAFSCSPALLLSCLETGGLGSRIRADQQITLKSMVILLFCDISFQLAVGRTNWREHM